jgi:amylosucrase
LRLDAIAFVWKEMGTTCQNRPQVHALTQALRAVARIAAPALVFKAEAIVGPDDLLGYLGTGARSGKVSDLAYHNSLMVQIWSALAARDTRLMSAALRRFTPRPPTTAWATYLRCHDDIGWAIDDVDAATVGWDGPGHRSFLSDYYSGAHDGSDARGLVFQENPATNDRRISGTAASLAGLEAALESGDDARVDLAVRRLLLGHLVVLGFGGLPLLFMGDELALRNDMSFADEPQHAGDNRWAHRPTMPWDVAERRNEQGSLEHRVWHALRQAVKVRAGLDALHASTDTEILDPVTRTVFATVRRHPGGSMVGLYNMSEWPQSWPRAAVPVEGALLDALTDREPATSIDGALRLEPYQAMWLVADTSGDVG